MLKKLIFNREDGKKNIIVYLSKISYKTMYIKSRCLIFPFLLQCIPEIFAVFCVSVWNYFLFLFSINKQKTFKVWKGWKPIFVFHVPEKKRKIYSVFAWYKISIISFLEFLRNNLKLDQPLQPVKFFFFS